MPASLLVRLTSVLIKISSEGIWILFHVFPFFNQRKAFFVTSCLLPWMIQPFQKVYSCWEVAFRGTFLTTVVGKNWHLREQSSFSSGPKTKLA